MAQRERKIIEEGDHDLYVRDVVVWTAQHREMKATKVGLSQSPRGKPIAWLYLFDPLARLWAVQLAEYCIKADLPWPSFRLDKDVINVLKSFKIKRVCLRIQIKYETHKTRDVVFVNPKLLRPSS